MQQLLVILSLSLSLLNLQWSTFHSCFKYTAVLYEHTIMIKILEKTYWALIRIVIQKNIALLLGRDLLTR